MMRCEGMLNSFAQLKRLTSFVCEARATPHYARAWDCVAPCREARMTLRNAIVMYSISLLPKCTVPYQADGPF